MLDRKSQRLDSQEVGLSKQTVDVYTQSMRRQFYVEPSAQAPKDISMIDFYAEFVGKLCVHGLNDLTNGIEEVLQGDW